METVIAVEDLRKSYKPKARMPWLVYAALIGFSLFFTWAGLRKFEARALD